MTHADREELILLAWKIDEAANTILTGKPSTTPIPMGLQKIAAKLREIAKSKRQIDPEEL
jgi:hypothetical protein